LNTQWFEHNTGCEIGDVSRTLPGLSPVSPQIIRGTVKPTIVRKIQRANKESIRMLGEFGVATVNEAQGRIGLMRPYMRPIYSSARAAGSAITVLCHPGDNLMIHAAMELVQPGDVMVVTTSSESTDGMFGDLLAASCMAHGVAGLIIEAGVRD